jgi:hypothetical protein
MGPADFSKLLNNTGILLSINFRYIEIHCYLGILYRSCVQISLAVFS